MSQTLTYSWQLAGSGWAINYDATVTISVSRSYGSDTARVTASGSMHTPVGNGDSNARWDFWIKIGNSTYTKTISSGYHAPDRRDSFTYTWDVSVGATGGTLTGQAAFRSYDLNNEFGQWSAVKDWSQTYGTKGASTIASASNVNLNTSGTATSTVTFTSYSSSFTHKIKATLGSVSTSEVTVTGGNNVSKSGTLTFGTAFINAINTAKSGTATVYLYTYSGSTLIGTSTKTITLTVPSGINPTVDILSVTKSAVTTNPFTKICTLLDAVLVTWNFTASYGSALNSGSVTIDGNVGSNTDGYYTSAVMSNYGERNVSVTATDKRGNSGSDSTTFEVYEYFEPSISVKYHKSGGNYYLNLSGKYASVGNENNTRILKLDVYKSGVKVNQADINLTQFITAKTGSATPYNDYYEISGAYRIPITDIDGQGTDISDIATDTYEFRVTAQDRIASNTAIVTSGIPVMTLEAGGTGITALKPFNANDGLKITDIEVMDFPVELGTIEAGSYTVGGRYRKWNSGFCELWYGRSGKDIASGSAYDYFDIDFPFAINVVGFQFGSYQNTTSSLNVGIFDVASFTTTSMRIREFRNSAQADSWAVAPRTCIAIQGFWK